MEALKSIIDIPKMIELQHEALKFTSDNISTDGEKNWETIYQQRLEYLKVVENAKALIKSYEKQLERSENRCAKKVAELEEQKERLAQQIGRIAQGK